MISTRIVADQLAAAIPLAHAGAEEWRTQASVFDEIFWVFLVLGAAVGVVVIGYMVYNVWKYRAGAGNGEPENPPTVGELPTGQGGGKKLFLSFFISTVIVIGLIVWSYSALIYVDQGPDGDIEENMNIDIEGGEFFWDFTYENDVTMTNELVVPEDHLVNLEVTSVGVWHTFGIPELRVKADAIPGQTASAWFIADETGEYLAECFELCGEGHSFMTADIYVIPQEEFDEWYDDLEDGEDDPDLPDAAEEVGE